MEFLHTTLNTESSPLSELGVLLSPLSNVEAQLDHLIVVLVAHGACCAASPSDTALKAEAERQWTEERPHKVSTAVGRTSW